MRKTRKLNKAQIDISNQREAEARITEYLSIYSKYALEDVQGKYPELAHVIRDQKLHLSCLLYKPRPKGYSNIAPEIVEFMMKNKAYNQTQKSILEKISEDFKEHKIYATIWTKKLLPSQTKKINKIISSYLPDAVAAFKDCKTLTQIKKRLERLFSEKKSKYQFKLNIAVSTKEVIIGNKVYPIETRGANGKTYKCIRVKDNNGKRHWVRLEAISALCLS